MNGIQEEFLKECLSCRDIDSIFCEDCKSLNNIDPEAQLPNSQNKANKAVSPKEAGLKPKVKQ